MAKTKISEYDSTASNNTDINSINIDEGCSPSGINNAIRALMSHLKNWQGGTSGDTLPVASGGTGSTTATDARTALSSAKSGANSDITSLTGLTTALSTAQGGTGKTSFTANGAFYASDTTTVATGTLPIASGGTASTSITANSVILGNGTSALSGNLVAPSTSGNVLTSNGTTWTSSAPATPFSWFVSDVSSSSSITSGTTSYSIASNTIMVLGTAFHYMGSNSGSSLGVRIKNSSGTTLFTYTLTGGNENNGGDGGSGMTTRSSWSVAIPSEAIGGTLEFFRVSGSSSMQLTINQVVKSA